jgi:Flp pilus assembly protein TadD
MLGLSAWKCGELETAETAFRQALALDTTHVKSYVNLTRVLLDAGRPGEAYTTIDNALVIDESSAVAWRLKGRVCHDLGRADEAVAAYQHAIRLDPEDAWSMNNLAYLWIQQERFEEALGPLARAIELRGDVALFHNNLGMALERTGRLTAAESAYAAAVAADPTHAKAASNGERVAAVLKRPDEAPVDLATRARSFETEVAAWELVDVTTVTPTDASVASLPVVDAGVDSTATRSE